jgi:hypothetical protein
MLTGGSQAEADTVGMDLAATVRVWRGKLLSETVHNAVIALPPT